MYAIVLAVFAEGLQIWVMDSIDPKIREKAQRHMDAEPNSRSSKALRVMLEKGSVTTADLNALGYDHPPRAIGDVRDAGIPVVREMIRSASGKRMARYRLGNAEDIREDRRGGRSTLPKAFKAELLARYGSADCITGVGLDPRLLQIDHRVPYRVAGDMGLAGRDTSAYMLLDASSQRAKSWSCEQCRNFRELHDAKICGDCFWAYPEEYKHIAMRQIRRTDIVWSGDDVPVHDRLKVEADRIGISLAELLRRMVRGDS